jgi:hypothetical protein
MAANTNDRLPRAGIGLVMAGLLVQAAAAFFWSPGAFIVSAALGMPLVLVGAGATWLGLRRIRREEAP